MADGKKKNIRSSVEWDERRDKIRELIKNHMKADDSILKNIQKKSGIEGQLESSDEKLKELLEFGNELMTNIRVAGEMREIQRRSFEKVKKKALTNDLSKESTEAIAKFNNISDKWSELKNYKEPVVMFNQLESQKEHIKELMISKDNIIDKCQQEINRVNDKYYADQDKQAVEICVFVERIDSQVELIKQAYKNHLDLLQYAIEEERLIMAKTESAQWDGLFNTIQLFETHKLQIQKDKEKVYMNEIEKNCREQQEITRETRIRLERDAEALQLELRSTQNNVLMNTEKLDYNYQVVKKRNEENVIINNQQKRRLAKFKETITALKTKIQAIKERSHGTVKKMSTEVEKLYANISHLEKKSQQFIQANEKKYRYVWNINHQEALSLANRIFEINRLFHAQQLGVEWIPPNSEGVLHHAIENNNTGQHFTRIEEYKKQHSSGIYGKHLIMDVPEIRLLRSILKQISDRAGFLIEEKLFKILEPYTDEEKCLVRIDSIFSALRITEYKDITSLIDYFLPYSWCPNCSNDLHCEAIEIVRDNNKGSNTARGRPCLALEIEKVMIGTPSSSASDICSVSTDDVDRNIISVLTSKKKLVRTEEKNPGEDIHFEIKYPRNNRINYTAEKALYIKVKMGNNRIIYGSKTTLFSIRYAFRYDLWVSIIECRIPN